MLPTVLPLLGHQNGGVAANLILLLLYKDT